MRVDHWQTRRFIALGADVIGFYNSPFKLHKD